MYKLFSFLFNTEDMWFQPILAEELGTRVSTQTWIKVNLDGALHCPHDLTHIQDFRNDLPILLGHTSYADQTGSCALKIQKRKPQISLFEVLFINSCIAQ
jgi:hypothetical protein